MPTLDELLVKIDASTELMRRELAKGETSVTRFEQKVDTNLSKINKKFAFLGRGISSALAGVSIGVFIRNVVANTIEAEAAMVQLRTAVESTGGVAGFTAEQLAEMAKNLQRLTTFGDDAIVSMQSILLTFTRIRGVEFERTLEAILNVSIRMGTSLQGAAVQLGKALNDPVANLGELGRAGIQFTKEQKALIKTMVETGRIAEAQGIILDELQTQFGGAAEAARNTLGGALQGLKNAFGDLLEGSGGSLTDATEELNKLSALLQDPNTINAFANITAGVLSMVGALAKATTAFGNFGESLGEGLARLAGAGTPIDDAGKRIEQLQKQIASLQAQDPASGTILDRQIQQYRAEIESLEFLVGLNNELALSRGAAAKAAAEPEPSAVTVGVTGMTDDDKRSLEAFLKMFQTAEQKANSLRETLNKFKGEMSPEEFERIGKAIGESLNKGLDTIEITAKKMDPLIADMERFHQIIESNRTPQEEFDRQVQSTLLLRERLLAAGQNEVLVNQAIGRELRSLANDLDTLDPSIKEFTTAFAASFESRGIDALLNGDISEALKGLAKDLIELIVRLTVLKPLAEGIATWFGGFGVLSGGVPSIGGGLPIPPQISGGIPLGPPMAGGGRVDPSRAQWVGEHSPELFVPDVPGRIFNARQLAGMNSGGIVINQSFYNEVGLPPQWEAQVAVFTQLAASKAEQAVHKSLGGRR